MLAVALLAGCTAHSTVSAPRSAARAPRKVIRAALLAPLRGDLSRYLTTRRQAGHISAVALTVTFRGNQPRNAGDFSPR